MTTMPRIASFALVLVLLAGPGTLFPAVAAPAPVVVPPLAPNRYGLPDFATLAEQVGGAVVNISVVQQVSRGEGGLSPDDPFYDFLRRFGIPGPGMPGGPRGGGSQIARGIGSGFIVSADGYILTNAHVVDEASEVTVRLTDKREFKAKVVGVDKRTDVGLIKVEAGGLPVVRIGDPEQARVGEWVVAVGSPFGFENSVTAGIISAKARRLPDETYVPFLQTDVAINPGNSGGPLFNLAGEVIGVNSQIYSRSGGFMGISFAIPIDVAMKVKDQLQRHGKVERGRLGVSIQGMDRELAQTFGLEEATGALVASVEPGSPADKAGVKAGDVVLGVNGAKVLDSADLPRIIGDMRPGSTARLQVWRDRKSRDIPVTLGSLQTEATASTTRPSTPRAERQNTGKLGLSGRSLTAQEARQLGVAGGLLVEESTGPAARAGIQSGDVILAVNNQPVTSVEQFRALLEQAGERYALLVQRGNGRIYVPIKLN
jgi:serine protease Do